MDVKVEESVMGKGRMADIRKVKPLSFAPDTQGYYGTGNLIGKAFSIGEKG